MRMVLVECPDVHGERGKWERREERSCCVVLRGAAWCCVMLRGSAWFCVVLRGDA